MLFLAALLAGCTPAPTHLSVGGYHACLWSTRSLDCRLVDTAGWTVPVNVPEGVTRGPLAAGYISNCVLDGHGAPTCWDSPDTSIDAAPPGPFATISVSDEQACALDADGRGTCWGRDRAALHPPDEVWRQLVAMNDETCGLDTTGHVTCVGVWEGEPYAPPPTIPLASIAGFSNACGLDVDGAIHCWGRNLAGEREPPAGTGFTALAVGGMHACALDATGMAVCWGNDELGQASPPGGSFKEIGAGNRMTCGLRDDDTVVCWGCTEGPCSF